MNGEKTVDLLIPTYKPNKDIFRLLERIEKQNYPVRRICIVNTQEQYWDPALEEEYPKVIVRHIREDEFDHGGTRHAMAMESDADYLLFMTQDALPADRHLVRRLVEAFDQPGCRIGAAYARQIAKQNAGQLDAASRSFNYPAQSFVKTKADLERLGIKTYFCSDVCAMYDREIYRELGGFPRPVLFNEDMIFASRIIGAGYGVAYAAEALVRHSHNYSGSQQFHRNFNIGVSQEQHREVFDGFSSEGEGIRLVKASAKQFYDEKKPYLIAPLFWQSACKYAGYWLGRHYKHLPGKFVEAVSGTPSFWKRIKAEENPKGFKSVLRRAEENRKKVHPKLGNTKENQEENQEAKS